MFVLLGAPEIVSEYMTGYTCPVTSGVDSGTGFSSSERMTLKTTKRSGTRVDVTKTSDAHKIVLKIRIAKHLFASGQSLITCMFMRARGTAMAMMRGILLCFNLKPRRMLMIPASSSQSGIPPPAG